MKQPTKLNFGCVTAPRFTQDINLDYFRKSDSWVRYGEDNKFPNKLLENYMQCAVLQGIINGIVDNIINRIDVRLDDLQNIDGDTINDVVLKLLYDYIIFGGYSAEIIKNKAGHIHTIRYIPFERMRVNDTLTTGYYSTSWDKGYGKPTELPLNDYSANHYFYYYRGRLTRGIYPIPMYYAAYKSVIIQNEIKNFHLNTIQNNFNANLIINFNNGKPSQSQKEEIEKQIADKFTGTDNGGKFLLSFNDNKDSAVTIERLESDNFDEKYQALDKSTKEDIFIAFRATPCLFGLNPENNGFSKEEYAEAMGLFNQNVLVPIGKAFVSSLKRIITLNFKEELA